MSTRLYLVQCFLLHMREAKADERIRVVGKVPSGLPNLTFPAARQMKTRK